MGDHQWPPSKTKAPNKSAASEEGKKAAPQLGAGTAKRAGKAVAKQAPLDEDGRKKAVVKRIRIYSVAFRVGFDGTFLSACLFKSFSRGDQRTSYRSSWRRWSARLCGVFCSAKQYFGFRSALGTFVVFFFPFPAVTGLSKCALVASQPALVLLQRSSWVFSTKGCWSRLRSLPL